MHIRDAIRRAVHNAEYAVQSRYGVTIAWDRRAGQYNVYEENKEYPDTYFADLESAVDYFLKITEDDRLSLTDEEIEIGLGYTVG
jgi:hypothetical protein